MSVVDLRAVGSAGDQLARAVHLAEHTCGQACDGDLPSTARERAEKLHLQARQAVEDLRALYARAQAGDR